MDIAEPVSDAVAVALTAVIAVDAAAFSQKESHPEDSEDARSEWLVSHVAPAAPHELGH